MRQFGPSRGLTLAAGVAVLAAALLKAGLGAAVPVVVDLRWSGDAGGRTP